MAVFKINKEFDPAGDQPQAIERLVEDLHSGKKFQALPEAVRPSLWPT